MFIRWPKSLWRAIDAFVRQHCLECSTQTARGCHRQKRLEGFRWPVVVRVAVGEREAAYALRVQRGENLSDTTTAVVADEIHLIDLQSIEKFLEHLRIGCHGYVLVRCDFGVAMHKQIDSDASPDVGQIRELVPPQITVQQHAMYKQCDWSRTLLRIADTPRRGLYATVNQH